MGRRYRFRTVDVFTDRPLSGNPLAVFPDAAGLTEEEMQALAREMSLSETAFVLPVTDAGRDDGADYRLRIFTPGLELPFAGHPSIGTAWVLADEGRFPLTGEQTHIRQELAIGVLPLTVHADERAGNGEQKEAPQIGEVTMTQGEPELIHELDEDEIEEVCEAIECVRSMIGWGGDSQPIGPAVISTGLAHLVVPLRDRALLDDIDRARTPELAEICEGLGAVSAALVAPGGWGEIPDAQACARVFETASMKIDIDPATGAAAGPIAVLLGRAEGSKSTTYRLVLEQGVEVGRPSRLVAEVDFATDGRPVSVRVAGRVVPLIEGWVTLPHLEGD